MSEDVSKGLIIGLMKENLREHDIRWQKLDGTPFRPQNLMKSVIEKLASRDHIKLLSEQERSFANLYQIDRPLALVIYDCFAYLLVNGIIIPQPNSPNVIGASSWEAFLLTDYGRAWCTMDRDPIPEDPQGFIAFLTTIPGCDKIILEYISESLRTFNSGYVFASAVMLGAAAEKLFYLLGEALANAQEDGAVKVALQKLLTDSRKFRDLRDKVMKILQDNCRNNTIPFPVHQDAIASLSSLFEAIRLQRNDVVHPTACAIDRGALYLLLQSFPPTCKRAYDLISWLSGHHI